LKIFKNIFARFWAFWGIVSFIVTFLIIFIPSMFCHLFSDEKKGQTYFIRVSTLWMRIWLALIGCPLKIRGYSNFEKNKNYIIVFNHNALLDVPLSSPFVPGANKTIAKASFAKVPLFGLFYKRGSVLVDRKDEKSRIKSYEMMKAVLLSGMHMCIYPEGTRNRTALLMKPFYDGAFRLAIETGKEIIPCIIKGTKEAMPIDKTFYLMPHKLSINFLSPVSQDNLSSKELNKKVFDLMWYELEKSSN
jgi:1-acyl-sn-glycerol-3-phosphate acyltransferase